MILKAGDIRKDGDKQRETRGWGWHNGVGNTRYPHPPGPWTEVSLVGHPILASDLMHLEFRRDAV